MGTDDTQVIRIEPGEKIGAFKPECVYNLVRVTSTLDGKQTGREANWRRAGSRQEAGWRRTGGRQEADRRRTGGGRMPKSGVVK